MKFSDLPAFFTAAGLKIRRLRAKTSTLDRDLDSYLKYSYIMCYEWAKH